jgi:hypothetical protein
MKDERWGEALLGTLDDWAEDIAAPELKDYEPLGDKELFDEHHNFMRGVRAPARQAFDVFVHFAHLREALDEGDAERAAYESMAATWAVREIVQIRLIYQAQNRALDMGEELDVLEERLENQQIELQGITYSAERQQRGLTAYNDFQKRKKESGASKARELRDQGNTHAAIAKAMDISEKSVSRYLKDKK